MNALKSPPPPAWWRDMAARLTARIGLRGRVILLLIAAFAAIYVMLFAHALDHRAEMIVDAGEHLLYNVQIIAARQQFVTAHADAILAELRTHPALRPEAPGPDCSEVLAARLGQESEFANLILARADGEVVCSAVPAAQRINLADREHIQNALQTGELSFSGVVTGRITGKPLIAISRATHDHSGRATGVLSLSFDLAWLQAQLVKSNLPEGARLVVVDSKSNVALRHPDQEGWTGRSMADKAIFRTIATQSEGVTEETGLDGVRKIYGFTTLLGKGSGGMTVWLSMPMDAVTAPARREVVVFILTATLVLLLALGLVFWGGERMLLRPMRIISRQLDKFAAGDLSARTGLPHTADDIGRLARMLDETAGRMETGTLRLRAVVEAGLDALFILESIRGSDGRIADFEFTDLNARAEALLGMKREQVIGQKLCELFPNNRSDGFFEKYVAVVETGTPLEEEFPVDAPEIRAKWLRHQVVRVGDGIAMSSRDISAWKEMYAETRRQSRLRTQILKSSGEGIFGLDMEGRAIFVNPAACAMLQWTEEELVGQVMHALHHHTHADGTPFPREDCPIYRAFRDGLTHTATDDLFWRKDGTSFPVEFISTPLRDETGELVGAVVSFDDITGRKAQEKTLARAVRALKTLSAGNLELVHAADEFQLLQAACRVIVEQGGYRMAWVGYADDNPEKTVTPRAWAGIEEGYLARLQLTWDGDPEQGGCPACRAIRTGAAQVVHDLASDPGLALWRDLAEERGYASIFSYPLAVGGRVIGALSIYAAETEAFDEDEVRLLSELGEDLAFGIETLRTRGERDRIAYAHAHHAEILRQSLEESLRAIAFTVEKRDPYTAGHERRVGELAVAIAREMGLDEERIHGIGLAATVHDLGKIQVPAEILAKPTRLSEIEFMLIQTHAQAGWEIIKDVKFPWPIADVVRQHHERMDGSGYPQGLKDGQILLESRIMAVADVVEAMASHRPYRPALGIDVALQEVERGRGSAYDAAVADACLKLFREKGFGWQA